VAVGPLRLRRPSATRRSRPPCHRTAFQTRLIRSACASGGQDTAKEQEGRYNSVVTPRSTLAALVAVAVAPVAARADDSKLGREGVEIQPRATIRSRDKLCCGYPIAAELSSTLTYYWLATEKDYESGEPGVAYPISGYAGRIPEGHYSEIYTADGYFFAHVRERFAYALRVEGSGMLSDDRVVNYNSKCNYGDGTCYETLDAAQFPFGRGNGVRPLVPFKSVAVDKRVVAIGEPLYIPEFDGLPLPDGSIHDGCVRADDTGGHIKNQHVDFFVVTYSNFKFLLDETDGLGYVSPQILAPRCEYLRDH
jgi:3D (Asp-Asp-Asp) domain-containing protein